MPPSTPMPAAIDTESSRQSAELAAFRRMLMVSEGTFSLSFSVYNVRHLRDELIEQLIAEFDGIAVVHLPPGTRDVLDVVKQQIESKTPRAIFVLDIEQSLAHEAKSYPVLRSLNASRELWERWSCPVVFWVAEHAAGLLAAQAVDFWRYRSHSFEFTARPLDAGDWQTERFSGFEMVHGLPLEEKRFRRAELEQRLEQAGFPPARQMLFHVLGWMYELAALHEIFGDYVASESVERQALQLSEEHYGPNSPQAATALNNLSQLLKATNRLAEAEPLMRRALAIDSQAYGDQHPNVATDLNNLALLLQETNRLAEAEPLVRRALAIDSQAYGDQHPNVARDLNNLAWLLKETNRLAEAEPLMRRALAIDEQAYGDHHPRVAVQLNNLALLLQDTNRLAETEPLMRRALAIDSQAYGDQHPNVARDLNNLALLLQDTNCLAEAEPLMRRALKILSDSLGNDHPRAKTAAENLRLLLLEMEDQRGKEVSND